MKKVLYSIIALVLLVSCAQKQQDKPKYLWMCLEANFERFATKDSVMFYLDKAKETGFNHIVVDVKGVEGKVMYESEYFPKLTEIYGFRCERDWDYLQFFIEQAHERGMGVSVSASIFPVGSPLKKIGPVYENDTLKKYTCVEYTPEGFSKIEDNPRQVAAFLNPILPESRAYALATIEEILRKYSFDGLCLDYCRFSGPTTDFSEASRLAFEEYIGERLENFPEEIFSYNPDGTRNKGKYYKEWWEFRSLVIHDFIKDVKEMVLNVQPSVKLEYWAASWLHAIYANGQNWASRESEFYKDYLDDWATPTYNKTALADVLDVFITGTYLERVWGLDDLESIEYGLFRSNRDVAGACELYGSLYANNHHEEFDDAVYLCLRDTQGLMVFDIVQVIKYNLWDKIKSGIDRAEKEQQK
jgi:uncharacterized lipoprotein YddW (UPF0748 family)